MPLYFFLSGLFFKEYESFGGFLLRKVNKVLIPFAFFYLTTSFVLPNILNLFGFTVAATQSLGISGLWAFITDEKFANNPIWFLWALFLINIYFYVILVLTKHLTSNPTYEAVTLTVVSFAIGFLGVVYFSNHYNLPGFADTAMSALPFFAMGYLSNKYTDIFTSNRWDKYLPVIIVLCFALTFYVGGHSGWMSNRFQLHPILVYVCGITGTMGSIFTAKLLKDLPFITYWGRYSLIILCTHGLLLQVFMPLSRKVDLPKPIMAFIVLGVVMFSYQLIIPLMKKYLPHVTGQKDVIVVSKNVNSK
jgi:fucose 4-O-acetylase-like acetyltransferase